MPRSTYRSFQKILLALALSASTTVSSRAHAELPSDFTFLPVGLNIGGTPDGTLVGAEASIAHWDKWFWFGGYGDVLRDIGRKTTRASLGGEVGYGPLGIDAGLVRDFSVAANGYRVRGIAGVWIPIRSQFVLLSGYGGGGTLYKDGNSSHFYEGGALLKLNVLDLFLED